MAVGDLVLVQVGENPLALVEVTGEYEFVVEPIATRGVWFRHMRKVGNIRYYDDFLKAGTSREHLLLRPTLQAIRSKDQPAFRLIERWTSAG